MKIHFCFWVFFSVLFLIILSGSVFAQAYPSGFLSAYSIPSSDSLVEVNIGQSFEADSYIPIKIEERVLAISMDAGIFLTQDNSYARVVVVDSYGNEYLVFQAGFPFEDIENFENVCDETCIFGTPKNIQNIIVEVSDDSSSIFLEKIRYLRESSSFFPDTTEQSKKQQILDYKIDFLNNQKGLAWTAGISTPCSMSYQDKKNILFGEGKLQNTCGLECYKSGVLEKCKSHPERVGSKGSADKGGFTGDHVLFDYRDWHGEDWMTSVKNQASCGSCAVFGTMGAFEAVINTYFNQHLDIDLSEQDVISCCGICSGFQGGCNGVDPDLMINFLINPGVVNESCFPYTARNDPCSDKLCDDSKWRITTGGFIHEWVRDELEIKKNLSFWGPLEADVDGFFSTLHAVVLTGYGYNENGAYWIIKNSWDTNWGEEGYAKFSTSDYEYYFRYLKKPRPPVFGSIQKLCVDKDLDGYCNWGVQERPPDCAGNVSLNETGYGCCSSLCNELPDCDDSDSTVQVCDEEELLCGEATIARGGESEPFGSYYRGKLIACCGDDPDEFLSNGGCCNSYSDVFDGVNCILNPLVKIFASTNYPPLEEKAEILALLGETVFIKGVATTYGNPQGICNGCSYDWYIDGELLGDHSSEISVSFTDPGSHSVLLNVTDNQGRSNVKSLNVMNGFKKLTSNYAFSMPVIFGNEIIWGVNKGISDGEIQLHNIYLETTSSLMSKSEIPNIYDLFKDLFVYQEFGKFTNIYMQNTTTKEITQITSLSSSQGSPAISGDIIVWEDNRNGNYDIYMCNISLNGQSGGCLSVDQKIQVTSNSADQRNPDVFKHTAGVIITWQDKRAGNWDIYMCDLRYNGLDRGCLATDNKQMITDNLNDQTNPRIGVDYVVWQDYRRGNWDIYMYRHGKKPVAMDIPGENVITVTLAHRDQTLPDIHGKYIVWQDERNLHKDIYYYNIDTSQERRLTSNPANQSNPRIHSSKIVWEDRREGNAQIYMAYLEPVEICTLAYDIPPCDCIENNELLNSIHGWYSRIIGIPEIAGHIRVWKTRPGC